MVTNTSVYCAIHTSTSGSNDYMLLPPPFTQTSVVVSSAELINFAGVCFAQDDETPLICAVYNGHDTTAKLLLDYSAKVNEVDQVCELKKKNLLRFRITACNKMCSDTIVAPATIVSLHI